MILVYKRVNETFNSIEGYYHGLYCGKRFYITHSGEEYAKQATIEDLTTMDEDLRNGRDYREEDVRNQQTFKFCTEVAQ